jgi:hypothetical protein
VRSPELIPFPAEQIPSIEITAKVARQNNLLSVHYSVQGEIDDILLPVQSDFPSRKHDLWKATCFEFFIALKNQPGYWEFNLSPSSNWNVYAMDAYRQVNMREEIAFQQLPFQFRKTNAELSLEILVDLSSIVGPEQDIQLGVTAIIQTEDEIETYWALAHPSAQADFHLMESFVIEL